MPQTEAGRLELDAVVPGFTLESIDGRWVSPRDYKQRWNLVILYMDFNRCGSCVNSLRSFSERYDEYLAVESRIIVVSPQVVPDLKGRIGALGLKFPVLSDAEGKFRRAYFGEEEENAAAVAFITDRYGALRTSRVALTTEELADQQDILDWLTVIDAECAC